MRITVRPPFRVDKSWISRICRRNGLSETDTVSLSGASGPEASFSPEGTAWESAWLFLSVSVV